MAVLNGEVAAAAVLPEKCAEFRHQEECGDIDALDREPDDVGPGWRPDQIERHLLECDECYNWRLRLLREKLGAKMDERVQPPECSSSKIGRLAWGMMAEMSKRAFPWCAERLMLLRHATECPACFSRCLELTMEMYEARRTAPDEEAPVTE
jgi:hypothetical protein